MLGLQVARWVVVHLARQPITWLCVLGLGVLWPTVETFAPLGLTTTRTTESFAIYEIAFLSCLVSATAALAWMDRAEALVGSQGAPRHLQVGLTAVLASGAVHLFPVLVLAEVWGAPRSALAPTRLPSGAILTLLHLGVLALVLQSLPLAKGLRIAALPVLGWALPALMGGGAGALSALSTTTHLQLAAESPASGVQRMTACIPIIGWAAVALLVYRHSPDAIRRTR